ncbi:stalk domain-containing protein [Paenibacillus puerhi]|uniref:stalk domain-containing protein n=1 Tax=Paenibacillus puerhi TaxID=2692622 RepID=UPI00135ADD7D|nr:stalk domain-containing protein [Paenibacillus puerhi]
MKKYMIGGVIGAILATSVTVHAETVLTTVQAYLWPTTIRININGENNQSNPAEIEVLNYKDLAYVPLRFVSEGLGATVKYEEDGRFPGRFIFIDIADDQDLTVRDDHGIVGMGNFTFVHGNRSYMTAQIKQYKDIPVNHRLRISFYDKEGRLLLKQFLNNYSFVLGGVQTNSTILEGNTESADISKTKIELVIPG